MAVGSVWSCVRTGKARRECRSCEEPPLFIRYLATGLEAGAILIEIGTTPDPSVGPSGHVNELLSGPVEAHPRLLGERIELHEWLAMRLAAPLDHFAYSPKAGLDRFVADQHSIGPRGTGTVARRGDSPASIVRGWSKAYIE